MKFTRRYFNRYVSVNKDTGVIVTRNGHEIVVDSKDIPLLMQYCWCISKTGYAITRRGKNIIRMHRLLTNAQKHELVDHINGVVVDNRRANLRLCNDQQNCRNSGLSKNNNSGHPGVSLRNYGVWRARIMVDRKEISLGVFKRRSDAIMARKEAEIKYFGEFRRVL